MARTLNKAVNYAVGTNGEVGSTLDLVGDVVESQGGRVERYLITSADLDAPRDIIDWSKATGDQGTTLSVSGTPGSQRAQSSYLYWIC
jgi:hypothetical protein